MSPQGLYRVLGLPLTPVLLTERVGAGTVVRHLGGGRGLHPRWCRQVPSPGGHRWPATLLVAGSTRGKVPNAQRGRRPTEVGGRQVTDARTD